MGSGGSKALWSPGKTGDEEFFGLFIYRICRSLLTPFVRVESFYALLDACFQIALALYGQASRVISTG